MVETTTSVSSDRPPVVDEPALVERDQILRAFEEQFAGPVASMDVCVTVEGGWGSGRSVVFDAACQSAERSGYVVFRGRGAVTERDVPFGVLLHLLEDVRSHHGDHREILEWITEIMRLIARDGERGLEAVSASTGELLGALRALGPVLWAIDDAELVDDATTRTLSSICQRVGESQLWLLLASSSRQSGAGSLDFEELLVRHFVRHVELKPLTHDGVREIVDRQFRAESSREFVEAVLEATNGRTDFVIALTNAAQVQSLVADVAACAELEQLRIPELERGVLTRLSQLSTTARDVLEVCAVGGASSALAPVAQLAMVEPWLLDRELRSLRAVELLRPDGSLDFVAPVVRWAVLHELSSGRHSELHERWANSLASIGADDVAVVNHLLATNSDWDGVATKQLRKAARRLLQRGDAALAERALRRLLAQCPLNEESSLWLDVAACEVRLGHPGAVASLQEALARGAHGEKVIAVALSLMDRLREWPEVRAQGVALLQSLSRRLGAVDPDNQLQFELGLTLLAGHPAQRNFDLSRIEMCLVTSDREADTGRLAQLFVDVNRCETDPTATAREIAARFGSAFVAHSMPVGDLVGAAVLMRVSRLLLHCELFTDVDEFLEVARRRAYAAGDAAMEGDALRLIVLSNLWQGSLERADEALRRHDEVSDADTRLPVIGSAELLIARNRPDEALRRFGWSELDRLEDPLDYANALIERGRLLTVAARADEAIDVFVRAKAVANRADLNLGVLAAWRPAMAEALAALGHWEQATTLAAEHLDEARTFGARRCLGVALRTMATVTRESDARVTWLTESIDVLDGSPSRLELAGALLDLGALMVERGDLESAQSLLRQGLALASVCKAERLEKIAEAHLAALGSRPVADGDVGVAFVYS
jgi:tetratricopeptide (TPR) repeat protein